MRPSGRPDRAGRRTRGAVALLVSTSVVAACSPGRWGDGIAIPEVVFEGEGPSRSFRDDPWVRAVERAEIVRAAAVNSADFSGTEMVELWGATHTHDLASSSQGVLTRGSATVYLGPRPFEALGIVTASDGKSARVIGCTTDPDVISELEWPPYPKRLMPLTYDVELSPDGHRQIVGSGEPPEPDQLPDGRLVTEELCATVDVQQGRFDPEPDLASLVAKDRDDVVFPPEPSPAGSS